MIPTIAGYYWMRLPGGHWHVAEVVDAKDGPRVYWIANEAGAGEAELPQGTEFRGPIVGPHDRD
jgi:hypothetical protein